MLCSLPTEKEKGCVSSDGAELARGLGTPLLEALGLAQTL